MTDRQQLQWWREATGRDKPHPPIALGLTLTVDGMHVRLDRLLLHAAGVMTTRHAALVYLPTVGLWSAVRAFLYYHRLPKG